MLKSMYINCKNFKECMNDTYNKDPKDFKKKKIDQQGGFYMIVDKN